MPERKADGEEEARPRFGHIKGMEVLYRKDFQRNHPCLEVIRRPRPHRPSTSLRSLPIPPLSVFFSLSLFSTSVLRTARPRFRLSLCLSCSVCTIVSLPLPRPFFFLLSPTIVALVPRLVTLPLASALRPSLFNEKALPASRKRTLTSRCTTARRCIARQPPHALAQRFRIYHLLSGTASSVRLRACVQLGERRIENRRSVNTREIASRSGEVASPRADPSAFPSTVRAVFTIGSRGRIAKPHAESRGISIRRSRCARDRLDESRRFARDALIRSLFEGEEGT